MLICVLYGVDEGAATMTRSIVVGLAILTLSTSAALAVHRTHPHHAMNANATAPATPAPSMWTGGVSSSDHATYMKNLHDSGYNPKNDFNAAGNMARVKNPCRLVHSGIQ